MALVIETRSSHGSVSRTHLRAGTTRVVVRPGDTFRLYDEDTGKAPAKAVVKQLDNNRSGKRPSEKSNRHPQAIHKTA